MTDGIKVFSFSIDKVLKKHGNYFSKCVETLYVK